MKTIRAEATGIGHNEGQPLAPIERFAFTPTEAGAASGLSRTKIFTAIRDGELEAVKAGKSTLIMPDALRRYLASLPRRARRPGRPGRRAAP